MTDHANSQQASVVEISTAMVDKCDEAACRRDGLFRDLFSPEDRADIIIVILRAALASAKGE